MLIRRSADLEIQSFFLLSSPSCRYCSLNAALSSNGFLPCANHSPGLFLRDEAYRGPDFSALVLSRDKRE